MFFNNKNTLMVLEDEACADCEKFFNKNCIIVHTMFLDMKYKIERELIVKKCSKHIPLAYEKRVQEKDE